MRPRRRAHTASLESSAGPRESRGVPPASQSATRTAWLVVALLAPVALLNYLDRQMLASMKFSVMADIQDIGNDANWGRMLGQFKWVYAFLSPLGGVIADRFSRRWTISASLFAWSIVTWITGHVSTYDALLWTRTLMGVSEAFYFPAALALIADHHFGPTRSRAIGVHQMAVYSGVILGGFSGYIADFPSLGWRTAFTFCGVAGALYSIPLLAILRDPVRPTDPTEPRKESFFASLPNLLANPSFLLLVLYFTLPALAAWVVRDWMPAILKQQFNIKQGPAGVAATSSWQIAAILGAVIGGFLADRWMLVTQRGRIYASAIGVAFIVPAIFGVGNASSLTMAIAFLAVFGLGWGFFDCNNMPILCQIVRPELRATGYGLMNLVSISCGGLADWGFGKLRDAKVPLNVSFTFFAGAAVLAIITVLLIRPRPEATQPATRPSA